MSDEVEMDLYGDWIEALQTELVASGYALRNDDPPMNVALKCFNVRFRRIDAKPRAVHLASSLTCPDTHKRGLQSLQDKARRGDSLQAHLSRRLLDVNYHDPLLNDWGLHHLHLGEVLDGTGFVERTGPLLFAHV